MIITDCERADDYDGGIVSTRGSYWIGPFNGVYPSVFGLSPYRTDCVPGSDDAAPDEIALFVHGFLVDKRQAYATFRIARDTLRFYGYDHPLVGFTWDSDRVVAIDDWYPTALIARLNGRRLAAFIRSYGRTNPKTEIRLIGHSLGAQIALSALAALSDGEVANVTLLGAAVDDEAPADGEYGDAIAASAGAVDNYHSRNDTRLRRYYPTVEWDVPVGLVGSDGDTPANYADNDVSDTVTDHLNYYRERVGCMDSALRDWGHQPAPPE